MVKAIHPLDVVLRPLITEKATRLISENKYAFEVRQQVNKVQIKEAVEKAFDVHVEDVHTMNVKGAMRRIGRTRRLVRTPSWKKAIVTLREGEKIEVFEGL